MSKLKKWWKWLCPVIFIIILVVVFVFCKCDWKQEHNKDVNAHIEKIELVEPDSNVTPVAVIEKDSIN